MRDSADTTSPFAKDIELAANALQAKDFLTAQDYIKDAMLKNSNAPEVHNLLGALAELTGDLYLASKHYRAAYALDPTYKPANRNLERITAFYYHPGSANPDLGDHPVEEEMPSSIIEYDNKYINHFKKGSK